MLRIYDAENIIDAQLALDELKAGGLDCCMKGQHLMGGVGEIPPSGVITLWISAPQHEQRARDIIREYEDGKRSEQPSRPCPKCGEIIEGNFGRCWNCNAFLD
ncbi:hypothetical protein AB833_26400 [Chromatiales bacterium (ex Bugula neritina AB1)]|nr:hypothetical protein AB833_26400 [Chromatiales bacterium (ex Bugula neritina AB1)]